MKYIDDISIKRANTAHPHLRSELLGILDICNNDVLKGKAKLRYAYVIRTFAEQDELYKKGRRGIAGEKIVTKAKAGQSYHNYGLAADGVLMLDLDGNGTYTEASWDFRKDWDGDMISDWDEVVKVFKNMGWIWGGDWDNDGKSSDETFLDFPHFQKTFGLSVSQCLDRYKKKIYIPGTTYIQL